MTKQCEITRECLPWALETLMGIVGSINAVEWQGIETGMMCTGIDIESVPQKNTWLATVNFTRPKMIAAAGLPVYPVVGFGDVLKGWIWL
jgi:hypothetical protein